VEKGLCAANVLAGLSVQEVPRLEGGAIRLRVNGRRHGGFPCRFQLAADGGCDSAR
jgi:hypothetical protein